VYIIRSIGRFNLLSTFLQLENAGHTDNAHIACVKAKGLRIRPTDDKKSMLTLDGELLPYKPLELRVFRGVLNLLAR
jgi:diacylglycerol kinase family enzyme